MKPNVVLILIDAARYDRFGFNGYSVAHTPNLDRLASRSTVFDHAYATAPWTFPSVAAIFTGLYPDEHRLHFGNRTLPSSTPLLAEILSGVGYTTFGASSNPWVGPGASLHRGFSEFKLVDRLFDNVSPPRWQSGLNRLYNWIRGAPDSGGTRVSRYAQQRISAATRSEPFFMFLHYLEPHGPYNPDWATARRFFNSKREYKVAKKTLANVELAYLAGAQSVSPHELDQISRLYDALVAYTDEQVGRVCEALEDAGRFDDTLIIVTADHGENLGDHNLIGHQYCLYDSLLHVPLTIKFPYQKRGTRSTERVSNLDLFASILAQAGQGQPTETRARFVDLSPQSQYTIGRGEPLFASYRRPMIERFEFYYPGFDYGRYNHEYASARDKEFKLIQRSDGNVELFNYLKDPNELSNVAANRPDIVGALQASLTSLGVEVDRRAVDEINPSDDLDPLTKERLRALGYWE